MDKLIGVIYALLMLLKSHMAAKEQEDAQKQANDISKDPTDWFNTHFDGGMSDNSGASPSGKATHLRTDSKRPDVHELTRRK